MTDKEKLIKIKSLADKMYNAAFNLTTDASLLRKAMEEYHQFIIYKYHKEETVSEELIIELKSIVNIRELAHQGIPVIKIARHIANWQKEKDNELTWEDMFDIFRLVNVVLDDYADGKTKKEVGEEVLRRFKESR